MGSILNLSVPLRREAPNYEVCTWADPVAAVTSRRLLPGGIRPGRGRTKKGWGRDRGRRRHPRQGSPKGHAARLRPYGRRTEWKRAPPGPKLAPGPRAHRPGRHPWAQSPPARPSVGNPARDGASPLGRSSEPRPAPTLTSSSSSSPSQRSPPAVPPPPTFRTGSSTENVSASTEESEPR